MTEKITFNLIKPNGIIDFPEYQFWSNNLDLVSYLNHLIKTSSFASSRLTNIEMEPSIFSNSCWAR